MEVCNGLSNAYVDVRCIPLKSGVYFSFELSKITHQRGCESNTEISLATLRREMKEVGRYAAYGNSNIA